MDTNSMYVAHWELDYRKERTRREWVPVRRKHKAHYPHPPRPLDREFTA